MNEPKVTPTDVPMDVKNAIEDLRRLVDIFAGLQDLRQEYEQDFAAHFKRVTGKELWDGSPEISWFDTRRNLISFLDFGLIDDLGELADKLMVFAYPSHPEATHQPRKRRAA